MRVLVTGGAGYIGSHVAHALVDAGHGVVVLDNLSTGVRANVPAAADFVHGDVGDQERVGALLHDEGIDAVLHFAGAIVVPESVADPLKYYRVNTAKTRDLLAACVAAGVDRFLFSSTAAVYGQPESLPITEDTPLAPINPYGRSKLMTEWMLADLAAATPLRYTALRYFNVAGADPEGRTGQSTPDATHLIKVASQTAVGARSRMAIFGTDYPTRDGTCIRDYIHVSDLATAHVLALEALAETGENRVLNCGYSRGFTVREVIDAVKRVSGEDFEVREEPRRAGDPPELVADSTRLREQLGWSPHHDDLDVIVRTAMDWEAKLR